MSTLQDINPECLDKSNCNPVETIIIPRSADIGGFEVHRALPSRKRQMVGPFIFWDQMGPGEFITGKGVDVRPHPHIGLSTVTYLFSGTLDHKDSLGSNKRITPGDVNIMTAGQGITHSERTGQDIRQAPSDLFGIQSWLALPEKHEETAPAFEHTAKSDLPLLEDTGVKARLIMGEYQGHKAPAQTFSETLYLDIELEVGQTFILPKDTEERAIYAINGQIEIAGTTFEPNQLLVFKPGHDIRIKARTNTRFMALGGSAMDGPRHIWWNFVSSHKERIEQAKSDWQNGKFPEVKDDPEFIPLPE